MIDIKWTIGGGLIYSKELSLQLEILRIKYGFKDFKLFVDTFYDCPEQLLWRGGIATKKTEMSLDDCIKLIDNYNSHGIGFNFTVSNTLLEEHHLDDEASNYIFKRTENSLNGAIVASDILRDYIKDRYPKFKIISSLIRMDRDYNKLLQSHDIVVVNPSDNRDIKLLYDIKDRDRLEIMVNDACVPNCTLRRKHYDDIAMHLLYPEKYKQAGLPENPNTCLIPQEAQKSVMALNYNDIIDLYNLGIRNFKLRTRTLNDASFALSQISHFIELPLLRYIIKTSGLIKGYEI